MGTYAIICCHASLEYIQPKHISAGSNKIHHIPYRGDLGCILLHLMSFSYEAKGRTRWTGVELIDDTNFLYETVGISYLDVTETAVRTYNEIYSDDAARMAGAGHRLEHIEPFKYTP